MILSVTSVCLQYLFGIALTTYFVRGFNLLGAGFYWLMYSVSAAFSLFAVLASSGDIQKISFVILLAFVVQLVESIVNRDKVRGKLNLLQSIIAYLVMALTFVSLIVQTPQSFEGGNVAIEFSRLLVGGLLIGGVTTAMLVGHWYLVQPGMSRKPLERLCDIFLAVLFLDVVLWLMKPSMISVITGAISDGWGGTIGYMWVGSVVTTFALLLASRLALKEKSYTAVMATTGLLYLAVLVANGVELLPRTIFA